MKKLLLLSATFIIFYTSFSQTTSQKLDDYLLAAQKAGLFNNKQYKLPAPKTARKELKLEESVLSRYAGDYELTPALHIVVKVDNGKLFGQATGQAPFELYAEREDFFFLKVVDAQVEFLKNSAGKVDKMILYQNGLKLAGQKKME